VRLEQRLLNDVGRLEFARGLPAELLPGEEQQVIPETLESCFGLWVHQIPYKE
jgi:hypothetical protein